MRSNLIQAAGGILTVLALAALPQAVSARGGGGGGHGGGGHGGHGGGHHGGGHHGGHHYGGHHYGGHHYGGHYGHSYAHSGNGYGGHSYSYGYHNPGYVHSGMRRSSGYVSGSPNGYYRHRYQYPYGNSYFFGYNSPFGLLNYGYGYGGNGYGYGNNWPYYYYQPNCTWNVPANNTYVSAVNAYPVTQPAAPQASGANATISSYAVEGEANFKLGNYAVAESDFRHALVDDPNNGALMLLLAQSLFANGKFDEAAGAVQRGMQMLPTDKWGAVVSNYAELYRGNQDYTDQLRKLEAVRLATSSPALEFLLGYHYGYLGYPKHATTELDKAIKLAPQDQASQKLRSVMAAK